MKLIELIGSGDKIMLFTLPFLVIGLGINILNPEWFYVGGPEAELQIISIILFTAGVIIWLWSVYLILARASKNKLITNGPFAIVKHPLYTSVSLLVLPWFGFLCDTWLGIIIGGAMYIGSRKYASEEERKLAKTFGENWEAYKTKVQIPWL